MIAFQTNGRTYLVNSSWPSFETLELPDSGLVGFVVDYDLLWHVHWFARSLSSNKADWKTFRIFQSDDVATTRRLLQLFDTVTQDFYIRQLRCSFVLLSARGLDDS